MSSVIDYGALEEQRTEGLRAELTDALSARRASGAGSHGLRKQVLDHIVLNDYARAATEIDAYVEHHSELPDLKVRTEKYVTHCKELIEAIEMKRNFPGLSSLSKSKQQEILEKVLSHFEELKDYLKKIEKIYMDLRMEDLRSTVWVLKSGAHTVFVVVAVAFVIEFFVHGLAGSINVLMNLLVDDILTLILGAP